MKNRKQFIFIMIAVSMIFFTVIMGFSISESYLDSGCSNLRRIDDVQKQRIKLNYAFGEREETGISKDAFEIDGDKYGIESADIIAVVKPTGRLIQTEGSLGQEITVNKILRGAEYVKEDETTIFYQYFGFQPMEDGIQFLNTLNIMYPEYEYLLFADSSPLNEYQKEKVFVLKSVYLGYVKITDEKTKILDADYKGYDFSELKEYEFFSTSEKVANVMNDIRKDILNEYLQ